MTKSDYLDNATDLGFLETFILHFHILKYGLQSLTNQYLSDLIATIRKHQSKSLRVRMFCQFAQISEKCGIPRAEEYHIQSLKFYLYALAFTKALLGTKGLLQLEQGTFKITSEFAKNLLLRMRSFDPAGRDSIVNKVMEKENIGK